MGGSLAKLDADVDASADVLNNLKNLSVVGIEKGGVVGIESGGVSINTGGVSILVIAVVVVILFFILIMYLIWNHMKEMRLVENALPLRDKKEEDQEQERNQNMKTTPPSWKNNFAFYGLILTTIFLITSLGILLWMNAELKENVEFNTRALSITTKILAEIQGLGEAGCFNRIEPLDGKWCESWDEPSNYLGICDGTRTDCVFKGRMKCDKDSKCLGITFPYRDYESRQNAWFKEKRGVAVCKSRNLLNRSEKDWNVYQKCSEEAGCFNKIEPLDGKWCGADESYRDICDGTRTDCVSKGRMKCDTDSNCFGIAFPYRDDDSRQNDWFSANRGVIVCKSKNLLNRPAKDWNVYQKC